MGWRRDKVVNNLPWALVQDIDKQSREDNFQSSSGIVSLTSDCYRPPKNPTEAVAHSELVGQGYLVLRRGWPDFLVWNKDELFVMEIKADGDSLRPSQRVVLELLAGAGIDAYVRWGSEEPYRYERIGKSKHWSERVAQTASTG